MTLRFASIFYFSKMADKAIEVEGENSIKGISKEIFQKLNLKAVEEPTPIKKITDLTYEEKKQIIINLKAGKENEHYELVKNCEKKD